MPDVFDFIPVWGNIPSTDIHVSGLVSQRRVWLAKLVSGPAILILDQSKWSALSGAC